MVLTAANIFDFVIGIVLLIIVLKILTLPLKIIIKFVINSIVGGIALYVCAFFGLIINVEWWTIVLTGLFGLPGFLIAFVITFLI